MSHYTCKLKCQWQCYDNHEMLNFELWDQVTWKWSMKFLTMMVKLIFRVFISLNDGHITLIMVVVKGVNDG